MEQDVDHQCEFCETVGQIEVSNSLTNLRNPRLSTQINNIHSDATKKTSFNLGNGQIFIDPDKASKAFIEREIQEIMNIVNTSHEPIFIPDVKCDATSLNQSNKKVTPMKIKLFQAFKEMLKHGEVLNAVAILNCRDNLEKSMEFDMIVVIEPLRAIIHIDIKQSLTKSNIDKAKKNFEKGEEFLKKNVPLLDREEWQYNKVLCYEKNETDPLNACKKCMPFLMTSNTRPNEWWDVFKKLQWNPSVGGDPTTYEMLMRQFLCPMFWSKDLPRGESDTTENLFFWDRNQHSVLYDTEKTRLILTGGHGTGKTKLMRARAKLRMEPNKKTIFILFLKNKNSLLKYTTEEELKFVTVRIVTDTGKKLETEVDEIIEKNQYCNFYLEEVLIGEIHEKYISALAKKVQPGSDLWISCQNQEISNIKEFSYANFTYNYRHSFEMESTCQNLIKEDPYKNFSLLKNPPQLDQGSCTFFEGLNLECAVKCLSGLLEDNRSRTIIKIESYSKDLLDALKESAFKDRLLDGKLSSDAKKFITSDAKILLVTFDSESLLKGFEVPQLVLLAKEITKTLLETVLPVCQSRLIIICFEEQPKSQKPSSEIKNIDSSSKEELEKTTSDLIHIGQEPNKPEEEKRLLTEQKDPEALTMATCCKLDKKRLLWASIAILLICAGVAAGCFLGLFYGSKVLSALDCNDDGFENVQIESSLRLLYINEMMSFTNAQEKCKDLNSILWDVQSGAEWNAVKLKFKGKNLDIWLNGKVTESPCPSGEECFRSNATEGAGLPLIWETDKQMAKYSRLYKGATSEKKCVIVEDNDKNLWTMAYCDYEEHNGICIKRNCKEN